MERTTLGTKLSDIEKKLGGTGEMPPAGTYDPLLWHLDKIESLIGGESGTLNDWEGLSRLLDSIGMDISGESHPLEGTIDETFKFDYSNAGAEYDLIGAAFESIDSESVQQIINSSKVCILPSLSVYLPTSENSVSLGNCTLDCWIETDAETGDSRIFLRYCIPNGFTGSGEVFVESTPLHVSGTIRVIY